MQITTNGEHYKALAQYATYNLWREFSNVTDPHEFELLKKKAINFGLTDLANDLQAEWEIVKMQFIEDVQNEMQETPQLDIFNELGNIFNINKK